MKMILKRNRIDMEYKMIEMLDMYDMIILFTGIITDVFKFITTECLDRSYNLW
jgi:hypothetical protein